MAEVSVFQFEINLGKMRTSELEKSPLMKIRLSKIRHSTAVLSKFLDKTLDGQTMPHAIV